MARRAIPKTVIRDIRKLVRALNKKDINIERTFLFGSYALGRAHDDSDIDIALVSKDFSGVRFDDNQRIAREKLDINIFFETHPYTPEDFEDSPFVRDEILKHGIEIL